MLYHDRLIVEQHSKTLNTTGVARSGANAEFKQSKEIILHHSEFLTCIVLYHSQIEWDSFLHTSSLCYLLLRSVYNLPHFSSIQ